MRATMFGFGHVPRADIETLRMRRAQDIRRHHGWYIFQGIAFIAFGMLAAVLPGLTAIGAELMIGALLLVSGIFQLTLSRRAGMHWWSALSALLSIVVGGLMLWHPFTGLLALVTLTMVFLVAEGVLELMLALQYQPARNWGWLVFSGIVALILAALLWSGFPALGILYIGWVIAINLTLYGIALLMLVTNAH